MCVNAFQFNPPASVGGSGRPAGVSSTLSVPHAVASGAVRRSNVVKEVERLKENREKRRQRQAELKEEKVQSHFPFDVQAKNKTDLILDNTFQP